MKAIERYEGRAGFRSYLFGIARRVLYRHYRDAGRTFDASNVTASALIDEASSPADRIAEREDRRLLLKALRALPLDLQILLELAYWEGLSDRELAAVVDAPEGTVKSRLRKARRWLDESLPALASSPELLESSRTTLDAWAAGIRDVTHIETRRPPTLNRTIARRIWYGGYDHPACDRVRHYSCSLAASWRPAPTFLVAQEPIGSSPLPGEIHPKSTAVRRT